MIIVHSTGCMGNTVSINGQRIDMESTDPALIRTALHKYIDSVPTYLLSDVLESLLTHSPMPPDEEEDDGQCDQCYTDFTTKRWIMEGI